MVNVKSDLDTSLNINENDSYYLKLLLPNSMYVCVCNAVTDKEIRQAIEIGASSLRDLREGLGVANTCGKCASCAKTILRDELSRNASAVCRFMPQLA